MLHKETVTPALLTLLQTLNAIPLLNSFRLVGGTAIALQIGHRKSIDIDLFSNEKAHKPTIRKVLSVELYDDWHIPFLNNIVIDEGIRLSTLEDLAAFKLSAITGRREKKDYIDLYFLFRKLGAQVVIGDFKKYDPLLSPKSILFALLEVGTALENASPMPVLLSSINWNEVKETMILAAKNYVGSMSERNGDDTKTS